MIRLTCLFLVLMEAAALSGQSLLKTGSDSTLTKAFLPLPDENRRLGDSFDTTKNDTSPAVVTGLLIPESGPIVSIAPILSPFKADGSLGPGTPGSWLGKVPQRIRKLELNGAVVGGFRFLIGPRAETLITHQLQVFWRPWDSGSLGKTFTVSRVFGEAAGPKDEVRIIELTVPDRGIPIGLYGLSSERGVTQFSLVVRLMAPSPSTSLAPSPSPRSSPFLVPRVPSVVSPSEPRLSTPPPF